MHQKHLGTDFNDVSSRTRSIHDYVANITLSSVIYKTIFLNHSDCDRTTLKMI